MTVAYFTGFETGSSSEISALGAGASIQGTTVRSGAYALKAATSQSTIASGLFSSTQTVFRFYLQVPAIPAADTIFFRTLPSSGRLELDLTNGGNIKVSDPGGGLGLSTTTGTAVISAGVWYRIEVAIDLAAGGIIRVWVDGTLDIDTTHTSNKTANPNSGLLLFGAASPNEYFFDDIRIDTGTLTAIGAGAVILRQPITGGSPTYDAWSKSSGTDAGALWDNTPFGTTDFCSTATASAAQTAIVASFASTQAGHGSETLGSGDTINAAKIALVGKTSNATTDGADSIRRRVGGSDTDVAITAYTAFDLYRDTGIITGLTFSDLTSASTEIGTVKTATGSRTHTVEDVWLMIDYTAAPLGVGFVLAGNLSATGTVAAAASAAIAGAGSINASAFILVAAVAALGGEGSLAAEGIRIGQGGQLGFATIAGTVSLAATAKLLAQASAGLPGVSGLAADAAHTPDGSMAVAGIGSLSIAEVMIAQAAAAFAGTGALTTDPTPVRLAAAALAGVGTLSANATVVVPNGGNVAFGGSGSLAVTGRMIKVGFAALAGEGSMIVAITRQVSQARASLAGDGTLTLNPTHVPSTMTIRRVGGIPAAIVARQSGGTSSGGTDRKASGTPGTAEDRRP